MLQPTVSRWLALLPVLIFCTLAAVTARAATVTGVQAAWGLQSASFVAGDELPWLGIDQITPSDGTISGGGLHGYA